MNTEQHPPERNFISRLFFGLFFDEWSSKGEKKSLKQNYIIDAFLFTFGVIFLIWFSLNNTFSLTHEALETSWNELEPYLVQDIKIFQRVFPEDVSATTLTEFQQLKTVNEKTQFYTSLFETYAPKIETIIANSTTPTYAKTFLINTYQRGVYSNEFNAQVQFFNYKLTDFPYSTVGKFKGYLPFEELHLKTSIPIEIAEYKS